MLKTDEKRNANSTVYDFWAAFLFVCLLGLYSEYLQLSIKMKKKCIVLVCKGHMVYIHEDHFFSDKIW